VRSSDNYSLHKDLVEDILTRIEREVYTEDEPFSRIGFRDENNGTTSYYSSNVTKDDAKFVDDWCQELKISPLNTRLFKDEKTGDFELRLTSQFNDASKTPYLKTYEKDGKKMLVTAADFADFMASVSVNMKMA